jgi:terminase small subunit-like protein
VSGAERQSTRRGDAGGDDFWTITPARARARELQAELWADEILEIADDGTNDWVERKRCGVDITEFDREHVMRSSLRVDSRKWLLARLLPKKYGDKVQAEHSGPGGAPLVPVRPR